MVRRFEEISNNAWPALQTILYDGWILRFAGGVTKRSNSVSLLYPSTLDPEEKITYCEHRYLSAGIPPCFKVTGESEPADMDKRLEKRGYSIHATVSFQTMDLSFLPGQPAGNANITGKAEDGWIDEFIRMNGFDRGRKPVYTAIMESIMVPVCVVSVMKDQQMAGVGLGVLENKYLGLFDIVVDPAFRNMGYGKQIVTEILHWGKRNGAGIAYLQVLSDNQTAIGLYKKTGFTERYRYWYRMKDH